MIVAIEKNNEKAQILIENLEEDCWWNKYDWNKSTGKISEEPKTGEELFKVFNYTVLFKHYEISVIINNKEYYICDKNKNWESKDWDGYNKEITASFWQAYKQGLIDGIKHKITGKQLINE